MTVAKQQNQDVKDSIYHPPGLWISNKKSNGINGEFINIFHVYYLCEQTLWNGWYIVNDGYKQFSSTKQILESDYTRNQLIPSVYIY